MDRKERTAESMIQLVSVIHALRFKEGPGAARPIVLKPEFWVLRHLMEENLSISELGKRLQRSKPNMTAIIHKLLKEGKISKSFDPRDGRIVKIGITEKGREFMCNRKKEIKKRVIGHLSALEQKKIERLSSALDEVNEIISQLR